MYFYFEDCSNCGNTGILVPAPTYRGPVRARRPEPKFCHCSRGDYEEGRWDAGVEDAYDAARER